MPKMSNGNIEFSENEAIAGICPVCHSYEIEYGCSEIFDTGIVYPFICNFCRAVGNQYDKTVFDGYEMSYIPEGYTIPNLILIEKVTDDIST